VTNTLYAMLEGGSLVLGGMNGPTASGSYDGVNTAVTLFDTSGGTKPACGVGTNFGIGSTYITTDGEKWDAVGANVSSAGTWAPSGMFAVNSVGGGPNSGFFTNTHNFFGDVIQRPGPFGGGTMFASNYIDDTDVAGFVITSINGGDTMYVYSATVGSPATPIAHTILGARSGQLTLVDGGLAALTFDGSQNGTFAGMVGLATGKVLNWNSDTGLSRGSTGTVYVGNGTAGNASGTLQCATLIEGSTLTPASATTAGVTGQIAWQGTNGTTGQIFICTSGGSAGSAIWMAATLAKV
jgi:hypothetical protein